MKNSNDNRSLKDILNDYIDVDVSKLSFYDEIVWVFRHYGFEYTLDFYAAQGIEGNVVIEALSSAGIEIFVPATEVETFGKRRK